MTHEKLPTGWSSVPLSEIADINPNSFSEPPQDHDLVSFVPMAAVEEESGRMQPSTHRPWSEVKKGYTLFQEGDILFAKVTPCMENGKVALATQLKDGRGAGSTEFFVLRSRGEVDPKYLMHFVLQSSFRRDARAAMQGAAGLLRVRKEFMQAARVPLAPHQEQRRIVAELEQQFTRLDAGVESLTRVQAQLKRYRASVLKAACEGIIGRPTPHTAFRPENWRPLSSLVKTLDQGWSPRCEQARATNDSEWAVIKTTAIQSMRFLGEENKRLPATLKPRPLLAIQEGDVLITRAGPRSRVGICCLVRQVRPRLMLCDKAYRIRPIPELLGPFLEMLLASPRLTDELEELKSGISDSGVNLTQDRLLKLRLPVPPIEEQGLILDSLAAKLSVIGNIESACRIAHQRATRMRQAILSSAFAGTLTPPVPKDESDSRFAEHVSDSMELQFPAKHGRSTPTMTVSKMKATR